MDKYPVLNEKLFLNPMINCPLHINPELEVVLVKEGSITVLLGKNEFQIGENQITVIPPYRIHGFKPSEETDALVYMFPNSMTSDFFLLCKNKEFSQRTYTLDETTFHYAESTTEKYRDTLGSFYEKSLLYLFLSEFTNGNSFTQMSFDSSNTSRIIEYIYENVQSEISLKSIASEFSVSETELNESILKYTGCGFKDFLDNMRIGRAINLLHYEGLNITEIAYESGFETPRTFNRTFLKLVGCSPSQYRKRIG